jgi:hypothetical protein
MARLDDKQISELKLEQARQIHALLASDNMWNLYQRMYEGYQHLLALRAKWQPLARRYKNDPLQFCDKIMGPRWFELPDSASARLVQELLKTVAIVGKILTAPEEINRLDGQQLLKQLHALATRPPGRKPDAIHTQALALRQTTPPTGFHEICLRLIPAYAAMNSAERRAERERIRRGVARRQHKKALTRAQGSRNSAR